MAKLTLEGLAVAIRQLAVRVNQAAGLSVAAQQIAAWLTDQPPSITDEIDRIPGRRMFYHLSQEVDFDINQDGIQGTPLTFNVSQDGPFIMTHYPAVYWRPSAPDSATNFGAWRPVSSWPLPTQEVPDDIIDISWEMQDGGAGRELQSAAVGPILSRPDNLIPLPVPTHFQTSALITFTPFFNRILFNGSTPPTAGVLHVDLPGYKIVNM